MNERLLNRQVECVAGPYSSSFYFTHIINHGDGSNVKMCYVLRRTIEHCCFRAFSTNPLLFSWSSPLVCNCMPFKSVRDWTHGMCINSKLAIKTKKMYRERECNKVALVDHIYTVLHSKCTDNVIERNGKSRWKNNTQKMAYTFSPSSHHCCALANHNFDRVCVFVSRNNVAAIQRSLECNITSQCSNKCANITMKNYPYIQKSSAYLCSHIQQQQHHHPPWCSRCLCFLSVFNVLKTFLFVYFYVHTLNATHVWS